MIWLGVILLLAAATTAAWPNGSALHRLAKPTGARTVDLAALRPRLPADPRRLGVAGTLLAAVVGLLAGGPVAAVVLAAYAGLAVRALLRRSEARRVAVTRTRALDDLGALAADLRAGLPPATAGRRATATGIGPVAAIGSGSGISSGGGIGPGGGIGLGGGIGPGRGTGLGGGTGTDPRISELTAAVWRLAERTGAPAADLVERIEADARAGDRARTMATAQAAGAQATAMLLAALPFGGIALGHSIGADALHILLRTPLGAACALGAVLLQAVGLLWSDRLIAGPTR